MSKNTPTPPAAPEAGNTPTPPAAPEAGNLGGGGDAESASKALLKKQRKVRILIPSGKSEHERAPVALGINGTEYLINRDCEVDVPESVCHVLDLAVQNIPTVEGEGANRKMVIKTAMAYPYIRKGYVGANGKLEQ